MAATPWLRHTGLVVPLWRANVDTDQIVPKQFLQSTERKGYGSALFFDWRGPQFVLDQPAFAGATVLIAGENFGCGSSREHAAWALCDFGFRAVVAPSFADIFANNAARNGLVCAKIPADTAAAWAVHTAKGRSQLALDLQAQKVALNGGPGVAFDIPPFHRRCLLEGLDEIGLALARESAITAYEARRN